MQGKLGVVVLVGACSFRPGTLTSTDDGDVTGDGRPDVTPGDILWRIETDADFRMAAGRNAISLQRDGIEPVAWTYGALRAAGANTELFTDSASATLWTDTIENVAANSVSGRGLAVLPTIDQRRPGGVGLNADDSWTMWAEGEIFLEAGTHSFELTGDDDAIFEVAGTNNVYTRVVSSSNFPTTNTGSLGVATTGWYPVRLALSQGSGGATFHLTDDAPGPGGRTPVERWRYRTRVNDLRGFFQLGADNQFLIQTTGSDLDETNLVDLNFGAGIPGDLGITDGESLSVRWAGQVWIDTPGDYVFHINSDGGHLFRLDGVIVLDRYAGGVVTGSTGALTLARGWHEIQLDFNEAVGDGYIDLTVESGPALVGMQLPLANLRPVTGRGDRVATATRVIDSRFEAARNLDTTIEFVVTGAPGANARRVDAGFIATHGAWNEVEVALIPPTGTQHLLYDNTAGTGTQTIVREAIQPIGTWPVDGVWTMRFDDTNSSNSGTALAAFLTIHYQGGMPSIVPTSSWTSDVRDLGATASVVSVAWDGVFPTGSVTEVQVRMCEQPDCADGSFATVVTSGGTTPGTGRYAQLRVVFTSDGDASPWLDWIDFVAR